MDIKKLFLEKVIFQVRFESGYLYWDRTGRIWKNLVSKWRDLKEIKIDTSSALFSINNEKISLGYDCNNINTSIEEPDDIDTYSDFTKDVVATISSELEIDTLTRIGNRFQFIYPLKDPDEAYSVLSEAGLLAIPDRVVKLYGKKLSPLNVGFRVSDEEDNIIFRLQFSYIERNLDITLPKGVAVDDSKFIKTGILIDIDKYTDRLFEASLLDSGKLIKDNKKQIIKKLSGLFTGGE